MAFARTRSLDTFSTDMVGKLNVLWHNAEEIKISRYEVRFFLVKLQGAIPECVNISITFKRMNNTSKENSFTGKPI